MTEAPAKPQLQMIWPQRLLGAPPVVRAPVGYSLRTYRPGDEARFYQVMELAGFTGWDDAKLKPALEHTLPEGWFLAVHTASVQIVATAMAQHHPTELHPFGGELGWVAADPAHAGHGLGAAVCAAVTVRLLAAGYRDMYLNTDDWRLAALKTYLKLGWEPFLFAPGMSERWEAICQQLGWPFTPQSWRTVGS